MQGFENVFFTGRQKRKLKIIRFPFGIWFAVHGERGICCHMCDEANSVFALMELFTLSYHSDELNEKLWISVHGGLLGDGFVIALTSCSELCETPPAPGPPPACCCHGALFLEGHPMEAAGDWRLQEAPAQLRIQPHCEIKIESR